MHRYNVQLMAFMLLLCSQNLCVTQEFSDDAESYSVSEERSCSQCFKQYSELDLYVLRNKELIRNFTETFFRTGKNPSRFVTITYNFQSCEQTSVRLNQSNDIMENETIHCTFQETTYVWSESILYLFGPKPLLWLTLFAVMTPEENAVIELPCLCGNEKFYLMDRLTYLVCV